MPILTSVFFNNTVRTWIVALGVMVVVFVVLRLLRGIVHRWALTFTRRTSAEWHALVADLVRRTQFYFLLVVSLYAGVQVLTLPETLKTVLEKTAIISILLQGIVWGTSVFDSWIARSRRQKGEEDKASLAMFSALGYIGRVVLWSMAVLLILDNLGINITTLIAGLGVGGIAMALAIQNVLGDLFASMSIVLDKPFIIGDFIRIDDLQGTVEHIGLKTTRIRSLSGEQIIFANSDLLKSRVKNYKRMAERRIIFMIGVTYQTPPEKLEALPGMIRKIVESQENTRFGRSHFREFGDSALLFETVYFVTVADYEVFMDIQQAINLALFRKLAAEGIEFAYPTQTVFLAGATPSC